MFEIKPMRVDNAASLIDRTYRESTNHDIVWREGVKNSIEAGATIIEVGFESQSILYMNDDGTPHPIYRSAIYDNGCGIGENEWEKFFYTYGSGAKKIGPVDGNFGIGIKVMSLPWNKYGLVALSIKDGETTMTWLAYNNGEYGPRVFETDDGEKVTIFPPCIIDGIDWNKVIPSWIGIHNSEEEIWKTQNGELAHGTVLVFCGNYRTEDTIFGDPLLTRGELPTPLKGRGFRFNQ